MTGKHAEKHAKRKEIHPGTVKVEFSPAATEGLLDVARAVNDSPHFDGTLAAELKELAEGRLSAQMAAWLLLDIQQEVNKHTAATGDHTAADAWRDVISELRVPQRGDTSFTLVESPKAKGRG